MAGISNTKRRFTDEQIASLEISFASESRPNSQIKQQLANDLGLEPRQVSIWFQNKRARLKTKQIARKYNVLKANHDRLTSNLESVKKEHQIMLNQTLRNQVEEHHESSTDRQKHVDVNLISKQMLDQFYQDNKDDALYNDDDSTKIGRFEEQYGNLNESEPPTSSFTSSEKWSSFESSCLFDESSSSSQWWENWP